MECMYLTRVANIIQERSVRRLGKLGAAKQALFLRTAGDFPSPIIDEERVEFVPIDAFNSARRVET